MDWIILIAAAFGAGVLNTIAGGGTFLTFPALVFAGLWTHRDIPCRQVDCCRLGRTYGRFDRSFKN